MYSQMRKETSSTPANKELYAVTTDTSYQFCTDFAMKLYSSFLVQYFIGPDCGKESDSDGSESVDQENIRDDLNILDLPEDILLLLFEYLTPKGIIR